MGWPGLRTGTHDVIFNMVMDLPFVMTEDTLDSQEVFNFTAVVSLTMILLTQIL